ncbi:putative bifunctional diguanylate cyclase/phosphodiesterase [Bradyrhizobium sp.]|uniref:putative bifunctional diguanylate cyclase/phosphodiesterase n=1 Tax=Bradyrhizobium sp. TaxID=376 RepID=UPI003C6F3DE7
MTAGERLLKRQLRKAATTGGGVDTQRLCDLVVSAYQEHDLARRRTEQSAGVMAAEIEEAHEALEHSVGQLRAQNVRFSLALDNMANGLALLDTEGHVVVFNRREGEILGLPDNGHNERLSYEAFLRASPLLDEAAIQARLDLAATRVDAETEQVLSDGRHVHIAIRPTADGGFLVSSEDVTERNVSAARIAFLANHDTLTGLPNRRMFTEGLDGAVSRGRYAVLCLDLDGFKPVNDIFGHAAGDKLLREVAARLKRHIRPGDMLARLGGDEFAIILSRDASEAESIAARVTQAVSEPFDLDGTIVHIGASVGIAIAPDDAETADDVMRYADLALYRAKETGRGRFVRFDTAMNASLRARRALEQDLSVALLRSQLELYYQPRVHAETGEIASFEALIRWHHPTRGMVPPSEFIPLAEQSGAIVEIGQWVLKQACLEALRWPGDIGIAVNVSSIQIRKRLLFDQVLSALNETGLRASRLELEITETALLSDSVAALAVMRRVQAVGVRVAMDDFGTGYSSLSYLHSFPFDRIKIDQSFVRGLGRDRKALAIVRSVIGLCNSLDIGVTAEGVETRAQRQMLLAEGCGELQGHLFGTPVSSADALRMADRTAPPFALASQPSHHAGEWRHRLSAELPEHSDTATIGQRRPGRARGVI